MILLVSQRRLGILYASSEIEDRKYKTSRSSSKLMHNCIALRRWVWLTEPFYIPLNYDICTGADIICDDDENYEEDINSLLSLNDWMILMYFRYYTE